MNEYTKEQLLHLDLPEAFRGNFNHEKVNPDIPWDLILLAVTILFLLQDNKE